MSTEVDDIVREYEKSKKAFSGFMHNVVDFFGSDNNELFEENRFAVHSLKFRLKDTAHIKEKVIRKKREGRIINAGNILSQITDFCGVRVLHLKLSEFSAIHNAISNHINSGHWVLAEPIKAYTWDPEYKQYFEDRNIATEIKSSFYTSVHYLVKPNSNSSICCEIQVRTLFEEIWGEIDHELNYPHPTQNIAQREQLKVLAKLVGAGTKLVDSIYKSN